MQTHKSRFLTIFILTALLLSFVPALTAQDSLIESVCLVTDVGNIDDGTFNQFAYEGMVLAVEDFDLESTVIETRDPVEYDDNIQTCLSSGFDAVITVGFLLQDDTLRFAQENPDVYFIGIDQGYADPPPNLVGVQFREDQAGFLAGAMAALMSESGIIGGVYGIDVPAVKKFRHGYEQGARYINPDITALGVYVPAFDDPATGALTAETMIGEGADVIFGAGGPTGSGGIIFAAQAGVYAIGVDQDEYFSTFQNGTVSGSEFLISSAMKRVDQGVYLPLAALVEGDLDEFSTGGVKILEAANDGIGFAPAHDSDVPAEVTEAVEEIFEGLRDGSIVTGVDPLSGDMLPTIADIATANEDFSTLLSSVVVAGLTDTLATGGPFTVFAPTDAAFAALPEGALDDLTDVLLYHVVEGAVLADTVLTLDGAEVMTLQGNTITISVTDAGVVLNGSVNVIATDVLARNGVIHVIDAVLLPE